MSLYIKAFAIFKIVCLFPQDYLIPMSNVTDADSGSYAAFPHKEFAQVRK
jgi:hypothetical protein